MVCNGALTPPTKVTPPKLEPPSPKIFIPSLPVLEFLTPPPHFLPVLELFNPLLGWWQKNMKM